MYKRKAIIVASVVYVKSCGNLHRDLHHDSDVLCYFLFTPKHYTFPFQNVLSGSE